MPAYSATPLTPTPLLMKGVPCYLFGSLNYRQDVTKLYVSNVALTSNVATLTVQVYSGEVPTVGSLITVAQTASTSGLFNVNRVALTGVTIDAVTGAGTLTYALTHANVASAPDTGSAIVEVPEIGEALANGASIACAVPPLELDNQGTITVEVGFPSLPTAATVVLQKAVENYNGNFTTIGNAAVVASSAFTTGPTTSFTLERANYYRVLVSGVSGGTNPTIVAKILA